MKAEKLIYFLSAILSKIINFPKDFEQIKVKNILIIKLDDAGDMVYATPIFKLIKQKYPEAKTTLWCKNATSELIKHDPFLDFIITKKKQLEPKYDLILDLRGNIDSLKYAILHPSKIRLDRGTIRLKNKLKGQHPHELQTNFEIIKILVNNLKTALKPQIYYSKDDENLAQTYIDENNLERFAVLHVGANKELRKWPLANYTALANMLKNQYQLDLVFVGNTQDIEDVEQVRSGLEFKAYSVAGNFSWTQYAALVKKAALFVGNESGPLHVAAAMETPLVGLFGPGEPRVFYPYGEKSTFVHHVLSCNPCDQIHCVQLGNTCMQRINLTEVLDQIKALAI